MLFKIWDMWEVPHFQVEEYVPYLGNDTSLGIVRFLLAYKEAAKKRGASPRSLSRLTLVPNKKGQTIEDMEYFGAFSDLIDLLFTEEKDPQDYVTYHLQRWDRNYKAKACRGIAREVGNKRVLHGAGVAFPSIKELLDPKLQQGYFRFYAGEFVPRRHLPLDKRFTQYNEGWNKKIKNWARSTGRPEEEFWTIPHHFYYCFLEHPNYIYLISHLNQKKSTELFLEFFKLTSLDLVCAGFHEIKAAEEKAYQQRANGEVDEKMLVDAGEVLRSPRKQKEIEHNIDHQRRDWDLQSVGYIEQMLRDVYPEVAPPTRWEFIQQRYNWSRDTCEAKWEERFGNKETWDILTDSVVNPYDVLSGKVDPEDKLKLYTTTNLK